MQMSSLQLLLETYFFAGIKSAPPNLGQNSFTILSPDANKCTLYTFMRSLRQIIKQSLASLIHESGTINCWIASGKPIWRSSKSPSQFKDVLFNTGLWFDEDNLSFIKASTFNRKSGRLGNGCGLVGRAVAEVRGSNVVIRRIFI